MANVIRLKRASGSDPVASDLVSGEPAVRTDTGELFFKKDDVSIAKVAGAGGAPDFKYLALRNAANNGAASYPNADFTLVTSGTTNAITPAAANTLLVSVNGVIQKPNTGTSTPSSGFALSGSTIKFGANISAAPDFILYQESGGIGEPSDETVTEAKLKVSNNPVNGYFLSAQSGNTGGLTWAAPVATSCTGNSATATALATARAINGVNFDGTAAITVTAAAGTLTGTTLKSSVVTSSLTSLGDLTSLTVTGDLVVDTTTLKVDSSNDRVGIGIASPSDILDVVHAANTAAGISIRNTNNSQGSAFAQLLVSGGDNAKGRVKIETNGAFHTIDEDSNGNLIIEDNGSERMRIDSSGRVQIGSTNNSSTGTKFVVGSGNNMAATALINTQDTDIKALQLSNWDGNATTNKVMIGFDNSGNGAFDIGMPAQSADFAFQASGGERMRITGAGRVLIGTSTSKSTSAGQYGLLNIQGGAGTTENFVAFSRNEAASAMSAEDEVSNLTFTDSVGYEFARIKVLADAATGTADTPGRLVFLTTSDGASAATERFRVTSAGHILPGTDSAYNIGNNSTRFANIYADTLHGDGSNLTGISAGATGGGSDQVFYENSTTVTTSYSITSNKNAMSAGPISVNSGAVVTVPSGSVWTIV